jgi:hypothetical protein
MPRTSKKPSKDSTTTIGNIVDDAMVAIERFEEKMPRLVAELHTQFADTTLALITDFQRDALALYEALQQKHG